MALLYWLSQIQDCCIGTIKNLLNSHQIPSLMRGGVWAQDCWQNKLFSIAGLTSIFYVEWKLNLTNITSLMWFMHTTEFVCMVVYMHLFGFGTSAYITLYMCVN